jgi:murein L,D-transpeptidase YafK
MITGVAFVFLLLLPILSGAGQNKDPYSDKIPDMLVSFGEDKTPRYAIIVEKETQTLFLFCHENDVTREVLRFKCSTGLTPGPKTKSGDSKTPEGVYFFIKEHLKKDLAPIYGTRAYPTDYPNIMDRMAGRDGNAIWLHGTNKALKPRDSNGCIVMKNTDIDELAGYVTLNQTPIIIVQQLFYRTDASRTGAERAANSLLKDWTTALREGTYHQFLNFYDSNYLPDISWWPVWRKVRKGNDTPISIGNDPVSIYHHKDLYVMFFDQSLFSKSGRLPVGRRKIFLKKNENRYRIIGDEYLTTAVANGKETAKSPLVAAYRKLLVKPEKESGVEEMIADWLKAWSAKDIKAYGNYYYKDFRSQGMNRKRWLEYKEYLNKKKAFIKVEADNVKIRKDGKRRTATFLQIYTSPGYRAIGTKKLILVREDGRWKIFRETWKKR